MRYAGWLHPEWGYLAPRAKFPAMAFEDLLVAGRNGGNLSSAIRVFVLNHYRNNVASAALSGPNGQTTVA
jgi:predicted DNA-binding ribbon-helix-helix protein